MNFIIKFLSSKAGLGLIALSIMAGTVGILKWQHGRKVSKLDLSITELISERNMCQSQLGVTIATLETQNAKIAQSQAEWRAELVEREKRINRLLRRKTPKSRGKMTVESMNDLMVIIP